MLLLLTFLISRVCLARIGETLDVLLRAARQMIKPELVLDPPEPDIYTLSGKQLVVATVKQSHGPVYQAHGIY